MNTQRLWKRNVMVFLFGQAVSLFGSALIQFAIIWYVARVTDSGAMIAVSTIVSFVPQLFSSLYGGVIADRYNRKVVIIAADSAIAIATLILAIIMAAGYESIVLIFIISTIRSLGSGIQGPAVNALIPQLVPQKELMRINGIYGSLSSLIFLVTPAAAGALLSLGQFHYLLYIDVITACIGVGLLSFISVSIHQRNSELEPRIIAELMEGIRYTRSNFFLRKLIRYYVIISIIIIPAVFLNVLLVTRAFGDDYLYLTLNEMSFFIGASIGGFLLAQWGGFKNRIQTLLLGMVIFGLTTIFLGLSAALGWFIPYLVVMMFCGLSMPAFNSPVYVLLQEKVSADHQGRVFSIIQLVSSGIMPLGMLVFGPLADVVPITWIMIVSGIAQLIFAALTLKDQSFIDEGLPPIETASFQETP